MKKNHPDIKKVYVVGMDGLVEEFRENGYEVIDSKIHDSETYRTCIPYGTLPIDPDVKAVVNIYISIKKRTYSYKNRFLVLIMLLIIINYGMQLHVFMLTKHCSLLQMRTPILNSVFIRFQEQVPWLLL